MCEIYVTGGGRGVSAINPVNLSFQLVIVVQRAERADSLGMAGGLGVRSSI